MRGLTNVRVVAAVALALLACGVAKAAEQQPSMATVLDRLSRAEAEIANLHQLIGKSAPRQQVDRDQVVQIVQEQMDKGRKPNDLEVFWDKGLHLNSRDGAFKLKIGGRVQTDFATIKANKEIENAIGPITDGIETRRLYVSMEGTIYDTTAYKMEVDLAGAKVAINDAYLQFNKLLPGGAALKVGQFKEPINLENLTSDNYVTFMERALPSNLVPGYDKGIQVSNTYANKRGTYAAGVFWDTSKSTTKAELDSGRAVTARVTYLPWYEDNGAKLLHVGAAVSKRTQDTVQYKATPEMHMAPTYLDTGQIEADGVTLCGLETALVYGPASVQGEYIHSSVDQKFGSDLDYSGYYVEGSYFLTGEHRNYLTSSGKFGRITPKHNFDGKGNWGAWQVAARYSHLDLDDSGAVLLPIDGKAQKPKPGSLSDITLGLNWYLNPNVRVMFNYVRALLDPKDIDGTTNGFMMRFQVDF